jgi:2'-5' RNA ligase
MQYELPLGEDQPSRPKKPERLFFALFPDCGTAIRVSKQRERFLRDTGLDGSRIDIERLHMSLHHVGDYARLKSDVLYRAELAGKAVAMRPFEVTCRSIMSFEGAPRRGDGERKRPLVLLGESDALIDLHAMLGAALKKYDLRAAAHFTPHMTLLYSPNGAAPQPVEPIRFVVKEFALIHSERGLSRYHRLGRWSFG